MTLRDQPQNQYQIVCYHCSSIQNYTLQNPSKLPKRPKKECSKCKKTIYMEISIEKGQIKIIPVKQPEQKKKPLINTENGVKESFHEVDPELVAMEDSELIRHTCREIIATKNNDPRLRLQASNLLLTFADKTGSVKSFMPSEEAIKMKRFQSMPVNELLAILKNTNSEGFMKPNTNGLNEKITMELYEEKFRRMRESNDING